MTRTTNARIAGTMFLLYIAVGVTTMMVARGMPAGANTAATLASMAQHASLVRINMLLGLSTGFIALTLGVALYGITREEDHELALLALLCRVAEGVSIFFPVFATLGLLWLGTAAEADDPLAGGLALAGFLLKMKSWNVTLAATFFAVGSTIFCWLLLRGRLIPQLLAWLGVGSSVLLVIALPLQLVHVLTGTPAMLPWIPMAVFEVAVALWFLARGAGTVR